MATHLRIALRAAAAILTLFTFAPAFAQNAPSPQKVEIPNVAILEGVPTVRVDSTADATSRKVLSLQEGAKNPLKVRVRDGRFYWMSHEDRPLTLSASGPYTYLASEPGTYIRLTNLNGRISYVEHVDMKDLGSVTWWGELRIVVGH